MSEKKKTTVTHEEISDFLKQTGFIFEMRMNELFLKHGYTCEISPYFYDLEGNVEREIDLIASKDLNNKITIHLVIECKQSMLAKWIFICTKNSDRYRHAVKHLPRTTVEILKDKKLFLHLHFFDPKILLTHNYICYSVENNKKTDHMQIDECVHKLPKAVAHFASRVNGGRHLFFPIGLFSGQIFVASYKESLVVQEKPFLQYFTSFRSDAYMYRPGEVFGVRSRDTSNWADFWQESLKSAYEKKIKEAARDLTRFYQIDFVTESGLPEYIAMVEKEVEAVRTEDWPLPTIQENTATL